MAADVTLPDGFTLDPTLPEGFTLDAPTFESVAKQIGVGLGKGLISSAGLFGDIRDLAGAGAAKLFGESAGRAVQSGLSKAAPVFAMPTSSQIRSGVESVTGEFRKPQNTLEEYADTAGQFLPAAAAGPGRFLTRIGTQALAPAVASETAARIPGVQGTAAEPFVRAGTAMATPAALSGARRMLTPTPTTPQRQAARNLLQNEGVELTAGQVTGNNVQRYRESMAGGAGQAVEERQLRQLTRAASRRIGEDTDNIHDAVQQARPRIGQQIENSAQRMIVRHDRQFGDDILAIERELVREGLSDQQIRRIFANRDNILQQFAPSTNRGVPGPADMTGTAFHNVIRTGSPLERATRDADASVAYYANRYREALLDAAERTAHRQGTRPGVGNRQALEDFREARRQWANMRSLEEASSGPGATAAGGQLTPASLRRAAVNREKANYARDRGDLTELAKAANLLMTPLPNSGTAQRIAAGAPGRSAGMVTGGLLGAVAGLPFIGLPPLSAGAATTGAAIGAAIGPAIQGRVVMSRPGQWLAGNRNAAWQPAPRPTIRDHFLRQLLLAQPSTSSFGRP